MDRLQHLNNLIGMTAVEVVDVENDPLDGRLRAGVIPVPVLEKGAEAVEVLADDGHDAQLVRVLGCATPPDREVVNQPAGVDSLQRRFGSANSALGLLDLLLFRTNVAVPSFHSFALQLFLRR